MKRVVWILVALAVGVVIALMITTPTREARTGDPRTLGGPTAPK